MTSEKLKRVYNIILSIRAGAQCVAGWVVRERERRVPEEQRLAWATEFVVLQKHRKMNWLLEGFPEVVAGFSVGF